MMAAYDPSGEIELALDPNAVPTLSSSAKNMNIDKLLAAPLPTYDASVPGSYIWTKLAFGCAGECQPFNFEPRLQRALLPCQPAAPAPCVAAGIPTG